MTTISSEACSSHGRQRTARPGYSKCETESSGTTVQALQRNISLTILTRSGPVSGAASETLDLYQGATWEALDDYTVKMVFPEPNAALLDGFSAQWLSRTADFDPTNPVGTGPFKLVEWNRNQNIKFEKNEDYWRDGLPYLDELTLVMVPDLTTRINMLLTGEVDVIRSVASSEVQNLSEQDGVQLIQTPEEFNVREWYMLMKNSEPPFDDVRVRQAINYAIAREDLLELTFGYGAGDQVESHLKRQLGIQPKRCFL